MVTPLYSVSIPGTSMICDGNDHRFTFTPGDATGGGSWPTGDFVIVGASISVNTDDPNAEAVVGLLGANGDTLTSVLIGAGYAQRMAPSGCGHPFSAATDELHFHLKAASGHYAIINGAIIYIVP